MLDLLEKAGIASHSKNSHPLTFVIRPFVNADWENNQEISYPQEQSQTCLCYAECSQDRSETHFLITEQTPHGILEQMMQRNPALRQLVDALQLELVGIEEVKPSASSQKLESNGTNKNFKSSVIRND